jgi:hypothetical protein
MASRQSVDPDGDEFYHQKRLFRKFIELSARTCEQVVEGQWLVLSIVHCAASTDATTSLFQKRTIKNLENA